MWKIASVKKKRLAISLREICFSVWERRSSCQKSVFRIRCKKEYEHYIAVCKRKPLAGWGDGHSWPEELQVRSINQYHIRSVAFLIRQNV